MTDVNAMILGCAGPELSAEEVSFFQEAQPWGFILFGRNIETSEQVRRLVSDLRASVGRKAPVFIDQEGGTVRRLRPPMVADYPAASRIAGLYRLDRQAGVEAAWACGRLIAADLLALGINCNCAPVLDMPPATGSGFMADRSYGTDVAQVAALAGAMARGLEAGGVLPVIKHIPGHGRGLADSHKELPRVSASLDTLRSSDFLPFKALSAALMAMTCHVVFEAIDPENPATTSKRAIEDIIRDEIGFDGLLISDDLSMNALSGDIATRALAVASAGVDIVLHCNGDLAEMSAVAERVPRLQGRAYQRSEAVLKAEPVADDTDLEALRAHLNRLLTMESG
ncbi:beta-N-acetylhexosaminidase [Martelella mediterranea]|uniref:beta-N-acetylhexosaminidase n=1 Tax=Martelella mediterranea TaxID=293089 RepID=A0A4R3NKC8_9HYPH|nr:beta-N-acetylhexosaminidase [Martelella mediterranea]TCT34812.1 beta-N-acetylhexosaminidase [Martelella mediterranea]